MPSRKRISLVGDQPLVHEYALLCLSKGFDVQVQPAADRKRPVLPKGVKKVARPTAATQLALELTNLSADSKKKNLLTLDRILPPKVPILTSSVTITTVEQGNWVSHPERLIGIGALPSLLEGMLVELAPAPSTNTMTIDAAQKFFHALGKETAVVQDSIGAVLPRILCMLVNEACFAMMESVASQHDIDTGMMLGTSYPRGPLAWAEKIGLRQVHAVLAAMHTSFGEERYRIAPLLQRAAIIGRFPAL